MKHKAAWGVSERQELLRSCGFRYFTTFDRMKPSFQAL